MSTAPHPPNWDEIGKNLATSLRQFAGTMAAAGAIGHMFRGDFAAARKALEAVDDDALVGVSVAASALSSLADEVLATRKDTQ